MQREKYIDIAKGIGILLVVYGHVVNRLELSDLNTAVDVIYSFHMPLFLLISGYCLGLKPRLESEKTSLLTYAKKIFIKLMVPYFVWSFIYMYIGGWLNDAGRYRVVFTLRGLAPIWFLATLAMCEFALAAVSRITRKLKESKQVCVFAAVAVLCVVLGFVMQDIKDVYGLSAENFGAVTYHIYVTVGRFFISFPVLIFGYLFAKANVIKRIGSIASGILGALLLVMVAVLVIISQLRVNTHLFGLSNYWVFLCTALLGSVGVLMLSFATQKITGFLSFIGKNSLAIMILHYIPFKAISYSGKLAELVWDNQIFVSFFATAITLGFCLAGIYLVKNKFFLYK